MRSATGEAEARKLAVDVAESLNEFIGILDAAMVIYHWSADDDDDHAADTLVLCGVGIAEMTILLTLRKFQNDLWPLIKTVTPKDSEARQSGKWLLHECERTGLREATNLLVAHVGEKGRRPTVNEKDEITAKIWWLPPLGPFNADDFIAGVMGALIKMRDHIVRVYHIAKLARPFYPSPHFYYAVLKKPMRRRPISGSGRTISRKVQRG